MLTGSLALSDMPLPDPIGRQREVLYLPPRGHVVVLGTAGSGKTTLAILRAAHLADPQTPGHGPTLLVTFNNALVAYLRYQQDHRMVGVTVETYHRFARGYLHSRGKLGGNPILGSPSARQVLIDESVGAVAAQLEPEHPLWSRPPALFYEELAWIARHGIRSLVGYEAAVRVGRRGTRVARQDRPLVYAVLEEYRRRRQAGGKSYDWDDIAQAVSVEMEGDETPRRYRHIVIDEGQDFSPEILRSLTKAVPSDGSVTFFGDVAQQIYGRRISWRDAGFKLEGEPWHFEENYRNSREIAALALAITRMPAYQGVADMVAPRRPAAAGPKPTLVRFHDPAAELPFVAAQAIQAARQGSPLVIFRTWDDASRFLPLLGGQRVVRVDRDVNRWDERPGVRYTTYHSAKGLEFETVLMPLLSSTRLPDPEWVAMYGRAEAEINDSSLLYVGVTRARNSLILSYSEECTALLPADPSLYTSLQR